MREVVKSCTIDASRETVWDFLSNYERVVPLVAPGCEAHLTSGEHGVAGAQYQVSVVWEGLHSKFPTVLQEAERPTSLLYTGALPGSSGAIRFDMEPTDQGGTFLTATSMLWMGKGLQPLEPFGWALSSRMFERLMKRLERLSLSALA